jgi:hypothetical protein
MSLAIMWVVAVTLLMMGGLLGEKAVGFSSFTLALPVSRQRLMIVRISMGLMQATVLAIIPWCAMFLLGSIAGKTHSITQISFYLTSLFGGGVVFLAIAVLVSSLVEGYMAPSMGYGLVFILANLSGYARLYPFSPFKLILAHVLTYSQTGVFGRGFPWVDLSAWLLVTAILLWISVKVIQQREF